MSVNQQCQSNEGLLYLGGTCVYVSQELPTTIGHLKSLVILNVDRNRLTSLPAEVSRAYFIYWDFFIYQTLNLAWHSFNNIAVYYIVSQLVRVVEHYCAINYTAR